MVKYRVPSVAGGQVKLSVREALLIGFLFGMLLVVTALTGDPVQRQNAFLYIRLISLLNLASGMFMIVTGRRGIAGQLGGLLTGSGMGISFAQFLAGSG